MAGLGEKIGGASSMNAMVLVQNGKTGEISDISTLVKKLSWETALEDTPGKLTLDYVNPGNVMFSEGSKITVTIDGVGLFSGFIFTRSMTSGESVGLVCYDQMRYLQNKDIVNLPILTSSEIFARICKEQQLKYKVVHPSTYKIAARLYDNKSYYEMMKTAIDETLTKKGEWYMVRDNFGVLEHVDLRKLLTGAVIGDKSLLLDFKYESSIDSDTFNQIKITKNNKTTKKRDVYIVKDTANIGRWGKLQYYEAANEDTNEAQIKSKAAMLLQLKNRPTRSLQLPCLGDKRVRAGNGIILNLQALRNEELPLKQYALVYGCTHNFENGMHTMDLDIEIVGGF